MCSLTRIFYFVASNLFYRISSLVILKWASPRSHFYKSVKLDSNDFSCLMFKNEGWNDCVDGIWVLSGAAESVATLPPFGPIGGQKWFDQISSQWESQKNRFALIYFGKIQFLPPCSCRIASGVIGAGLAGIVIAGGQAKVTCLRWGASTAGSGFGGAGGRPRVVNVITPLVIMRN